MSQLSRYLRCGEGVLTFWCPGCKGMHAVRVGPNGWQWSGDAEKPTFRPSVLIRSGHHAPHHKPGDSCWCTYNADCAAKGEKPAPFKCEVCHSFVTDGTIQFLGDCTHELRGRTVPLPELPPEHRDP